MSTLADWIEGARPRTLPAALTPVLAGAGVAEWMGRLSIGMGVLAFIVALALQIGVNFANDYSDGIRGTDAAGKRVGPQRLVGSGAASPRAVKIAAFTCFGIAAVAGLALTIWSGHYWLIAVGIVSILAAWYYTGGKKPYGYLGLGELMVFIFFGLVAVCGTVYVMADSVDAATLATACAIGFLAVVLLIANNLRDIAGDLKSGKRTLATRLGDAGTRRLFVSITVAAALSVIAAALASTLWALLGLVFLALMIPACRSVLGGASGRELIRVLKTSGLAELVCSIGLFAGYLIGALG